MRENTGEESIDYTTFYERPFRVSCPFILSGGPLSSTLWLRTVTTPKKCLLGTLLTSGHSNGLGVLGLFGVDLRSGCTLYYLDIVEFDDLKPHYTIRRYPLIMCHVNQVFNFLILLFSLICENSSSELMKL